MKEKDTTRYPLDTRHAEVSESGAPSAPRPADIQEFCGAIPADEAAQMIREIEEAFEQTDGG